MDKKLRRAVARAKKLLPSTKAAKCPYPRRKHGLYKAWQARRIKCLEESVEQLLAVIHKPNMRMKPEKKPVVLSTEEMFKDGKCITFMWFTYRHCNRILSPALYSYINTAIALAATHFHAK